MATDSFGEMKHMLEQLKMPGIDMSTILESSRKDVEALVEANRTAYEAMQAIARKQTEMMAESMRVMQEAAKNAADVGKQTEVARVAFEKTIADMKELAEMASRSQSETMACITRRAAEHMEEIRKLMLLK